MAFTVLRMTYIAFFMMMFLTLLQFNLGGTGPMTIGVIVFITFFLSMTVTAGYALFRAGKFTITRDPLAGKKKKGRFSLPWVGVCRESRLGEENAVIQIVGRLPWWKLEYTSNTKDSVYMDENHVLKFG